MNICAVSLLQELTKSKNQGQGQGLSLSLLDDLRCFMIVHSAVVMVGYKVGGRRSGPRQAHVHDYAMHHALCIIHYALCNTYYASCNALQWRAIVETALSLLSVNSVGRNNQTALMDFNSSSRCYDSASVTFP